MDDMTKDFEREWDDKTGQITESIIQYQAMAELVKDPQFIKLARESWELHTKKNNEWNVLERKYFDERGKPTNYVRELMRQKGHSTKSAKLVSEVTHQLWSKTLGHERKIGTLGKIEKAMVENSAETHKMVEESGINFFYSRYDLSMLDPHYWLTSVEYHQNKLDKLGTKEQYVKRKIRQVKRERTQTEFEKSGRTIAEEIFGGEGK